jgi:HSP20 family protein
MVTQMLNTYRGVTSGDVNPSKTFKTPFGMSRMPVCWKTPNDSLLWAPLIDMYSCEDKFIVQAEMPGVNKEDISVSLVGNDLLIKGERKSQKTKHARDYYCSEISQGTFFRTIALPFEANKKRITATYSDGVLEIVMPRNTQMTETEIPVKVNSTGRKDKKIV